MKRLLTGLCALALSAGLLTACSESRTDRVGESPASVRRPRLRPPPRRRRPHRRRRPPRRRRRRLRVARAAPAARRRAARPRAPAPSNDRRIVVGPPRLARRARSRFTPPVVAPARSRPPPPAPRPRASPPSARASRASIALIQPRPSVRPSGSSRPTSAPAASITASPRPGSAGRAGTRARSSVTGDAPARCACERRSRARRRAWPSVAPSAPPAVARRGARRRRAARAGSARTRPRLQHDQRSGATRSIFSRLSARPKRPSTRPEVSTSTWVAAGGERAPHEPGGRVGRLAQAASRAR